MLILNGPFRGETHDVPAAPLLTTENGTVYAFNGVAPSGGTMRYMIGEVIYKGKTIPVATSVSNLTIKEVFDWALRKGIVTDIDIWEF